MSHISSSILYVVFFCQQFMNITSISSVCSSRSRSTCFVAAVFPIPGAPCINRFLPDLPVNSGFMQDAMYFCSLSLNGISFGKNS